MNDEPWTHLETLPTFELAPERAARVRELAHGMLGPVVARRRQPGRVESALLAAAAAAYSIWIGIAMGSSLGGG